ncbi:MAG TPA: haloalkane dehalogenase [Mycobacteriales bacterium]|nr:haloalkane dehalogenase [Mycobacteriales bacterium]
MQILRTPDDRFQAVPDFPWEPRYVEVAAGDGSSAVVRIAYVEAGPADGPVVLCLHGEPTWSFLYRKVLRVLADGGCRAVAVDLVGFGRSDKPAATSDYTYARHVEWVRAAVFDRLDLRGVTLLAQDWGGLIGLRLVAENPDRFARVVAANTGLPDGRHEMPEVWWMFRDAVERAERLEISRFIAAGCLKPPDEEVLAAYDAPFPDESFKAGARVFPALIPTTPDDPGGVANQKAWQVLSSLDLPFLCAFSDGDPITGAMGPVLAKTMPGAAGREHPTIRGAGHFLQEDAGEELGRVVVEFVRGS